MKTKTLVGIDVAKEKFYTAVLKNSKIVLTKEFSNNEQGYKELKKVLATPNARLVMEATGPYYLKLAYYFYSSGYQVSVVNPLVINKFIQMQMKRAKTDKADAIQIALYAEKHEIDLWQPKDEQIENARQILTRLELLERQLTANRNQLEAMSRHYQKNNIVIKNIQNTIEFFEKEIKELENHLTLLIEDQYEEEVKNLMSIPGIGKKTAIFIIVITNNFTKFNNAKQLISYVGTSPRIFESGKSVRGRGHITKMGMSKVRRTLYMCTYSAQTYNPFCSDLKKRLEMKGKPSRVIKIAILNKLLRQAFAIGKKKTMFDSYYEKKLAS